MIRLTGFNNTSYPPDHGLPCSIAISDAVLLREGEHRGELRARITLDRTTPPAHSVGKSNDGKEYEHLTLYGPWHRDGGYEHADFQTWDRAELFFTIHYLWRPYPRAPLEMHCETAIILLDQRSRKAVAALLDEARGSNEKQAALDLNVPAG